MPRLHTFDGVVGEHTSTGRRTINFRLERNVRLEPLVDHQSFVAAPIVLLIMEQEGVLFYVIQLRRSM